MGTKRVQFDGDVVASIRFKYICDSKRAHHTPDTNLPKSRQILMGPHDTVKIGRDSDPNINVSRTQLEFYAMIFEDGGEPGGNGAWQNVNQASTPRQPLPPAIYVRDRMSSNGTYIDEELHIGNPSHATPGYLLRHGQRVSILGEGYAWVFQLHQPETADLDLRDDEMRSDNKYLESLLGYRITGHELGSGNFGCVYSAINTKTGRQVVCKVMKPNRDGATNSIHRRRWLQEIDVMKQLNHFNVLSFLAAAQTQTRIYYFAELASGGDLMTYLQRHAPVREMDARLIMRQVVRGVLYLHSKGIIHRDLKPENILFATYPKPGHRIIIADLGSAGNANGVARLGSLVGTPQYNAPEVAENVNGVPASGADVQRNHTTKVDTWAVGIVALLLLTGGHPFDGTWSRISEQLTIDFTLMDLSAEQPVSDDGSDFVHHCLRINPDHRLTDIEAIRHAWFTQPAEDVRVFEACDREALGGWEPRQHISPMIEDLNNGRGLKSPYFGGHGPADKNACTTEAVVGRQQRPRRGQILGRGDHGPPSAAPVMPSKRGVLKQQNNTARARL